MATYKYSYTIDQFLNDQYDLSKLDTEIRDSSITVALSHFIGAEASIDIFFKASLDSTQWATLSGVVAAHDGEDDGVNYDPVKIVDSDSSTRVNVDLPDMPYDRSGKLRVHQTSRPLGLVTQWTGVGDDPTDVTAVGGGTPFSLEHSIGDDNPAVTYIDLNCIENETWLHEGYVAWSDAEMDRVTADIVTRSTKYGVPGISSPVFYGEGLDDCSVSGTYSGQTSKEYKIQIDSEGTPDTFKWSNDAGTSWTEGISITGSTQTLSSGVQITFGATTGHTLNDYWCVNAIISNPTTYKLYGGYLIVPYSFPYGTPIDVVSDLTAPTLDDEGFGGLVYMSDNDQGTTPTAFWNATYNSTTSLFENITPAPAGDGRYNIFAVETTLVRFLNSIPLLDNGNVCFSSSDTDQLGHGMRLKITITTNTTSVPDHAWSAACTICAHRYKRY